MGGSQRVYVPAAEADDVIDEALGWTAATWQQRDAHRNDAVPWTPNPGPQTAAYKSAADIIGFGGAAGGGKTQLTLGLAMTQHRRSLILRREQTRVRDIWESALVIADGQGRSNENLHVIRDLPGNRSLELGGLKDPGDWRKFQGRAYDLHAFDEVTEFTEQQFRTVIAWNRTTTPGQRCRVVVTFNPPTSAEGEWVVRFFGPWLDPGHPHPAEPGELRWYATIDGEEVERADGESFEHEGESIQPRSRTFFPSRVADNPQLIQTGYVATLQSLPEPLRSQLLFGSFTAGTEDHPWQVIPSAWIYAAEERFRALQGWTGGSYRFVALGVDVGAGGDRTVLADRVLIEKDDDDQEDGLVIPARQAILSLRRFDHKDTMLTVGIVAGQLRELGGYAVIDVIGIGAGVVDRLREQQFQVVGFNAAERSERRDRSGRLGYVNQRSAAWWMIRELLDPANDEQIALPVDPKLRADLMAPRWHPNSSGRIQIESKEDIRGRLGRSPDDGDAVVMVFAINATSHPAVTLPRKSRWTLPGTERDDTRSTAMVGGGARGSATPSRWRRNWS